jgi:tetratricopeptide (TPR) repeat protein
LLAGRPPFVGDNAFAVMKRSSQEPAPRVRTLAPHVDRDLETICARCLERDPTDRYRSAAALGDDLQNWLDDRPILARRAGVLQHSRRWVRQNRAVATLLAAFCLLGAGWLLWHLRAQETQLSMQENLLAARSIAVLPFYDLDTVTADRTSTEAFAGSLKEALGALGPVRVISLEPPFVVGRDGIEKLIKEGKLNGARSILTGTVRMNQGRKRVSFRLVDLASKEILLAQVIEGEGPAPINLNERVSQTIYGILSQNDWSSLISSKRDPGLRNQIANDAMTAGRLLELATVADFDKAIGLFRKAVEAEPDSSLAHTYLAMYAAGRNHYSADRSFLELARKEAEIAIQLSPGSAEAHRALGGVYYHEGRFPEALEQALQTIEMAGLHDRSLLFVGMILDVLGKPDQALRWNELASHVAANPGEADVAMGDCWTKLVDGERAEQAYARAIEFRPNSPDGVVGMARLRLLEGKFEAAREVCRRVESRGALIEIGAQIEFFDRKFEAAIELYRNLNKANPNGGGAFYGAMTYCSAAGRAKQALGDLSEARRLLDECLIKERANIEREPNNPEAFYRLAAVEASLGMTEPSLSHLRQAVALGWLDYRSLNLDPRFDSLRGPEFQTIIDKLSAKAADMRNKAIVQR